MKVRINGKKSHDPAHSMLLGELGAHFLKDEREERKPTDKQLMKEHARMQKRHATQDWVAGRMSTKEHNAVHARADHVLAGKHPRGFKGHSGGRKIRGYDAGL